MISKKLCNICKEIKPLDEFNDHPSGLYKKASRCRTCNTIYCTTLAREKRLKRDLRLCNQVVIDKFSNIEIRRLVNFAMKINVLENGCWQWISTLTPTGYGRFWENDIEYIAHRVAFCWIHPEVEVKGDKEKKMSIDHLCRNRACVNPDHLERINFVENVMRGISPHALNAKKELCLRGHPYFSYTDPKTKKISRRCRECMNELKRLRRKPHTELNNRLKLTITFLLYCNGVSYHLIH